LSYLLYHVAITSKVLGACHFKTYSVCSDGTATFVVCALGLSFYSN